MHNRHDESPSRVSQSAWQFVLYLGAVAQLVLALLLLTGDHSMNPAPVRRDIYLVAAIALATAVAVVPCVPAASASKWARRAIAIAALVALLFAGIGAVAQTVKAIVLIPPILLLVGVLIMYRDRVNSRANSTGPLMHKEA